MASVRSTVTPGTHLDFERKTSLTAGVFCLLTFVSIPVSFILYAPLKEADYLIGAGFDAGILVGTFLDVIVALAGIGTAITLFHVVKRQNEGKTLGFVAARTLEAAMLFVGVASILPLVNLRRDLGAAAGADASAPVATAASHLATYDWAFTLGGSLTPGLKGISLGTLLFKCGLVPRALPTLGLIGAATSGRCVPHDVRAYRTDWSRDRIAVIPIEM